MIASDGMWLINGRAHPRSFGTYSRVLGRYVREQKAMTMMEALKKMTLLPAQRLETRVPSMRNKGRMRAGADADIVVFDPDTIIDRGTFSNPAQSPLGISYVVVNGVLTIDGGELVRGVAAGQAVRAAQVYRDAPGTTWKTPWSH
jgi:dihydroorotase